MSLPTHYNVALQPFNTFGLAVQGYKLSYINSIADIQAAVHENKSQNLPLFVLGGGSNLLLVNDLNAWILKNEIKGIQLLQETEDSVWVQVGGGEVWHQFVMHCVAKGWYGIENLALIPGTVGAAPIQNIGAYGVEVKSVIDTVHTIDLQTGLQKDFTNDACEFGYRESIFKRVYKNLLFIYAVTFRLSKQPHTNTSYGDINQTLSLLQLPATLANIAQAVIHIRQAKLPDPAQIGNSGSFFKNPEISKQAYQQLQVAFPAIPGYHLPDDMVKVPAAWLIEQCGWKGYRNANYGVHERQALVLVNYGGARGKDILELSEAIIKSVDDKFGIQLQREVQVEGQ